MNRTAPGRRTPAAGLSALRAAVAGPVLTPDDAAYATECTGHNLLHVSRPSVVVCATRTEDVVAAVRFAARHGMPVAVRNAGHQTVLPETGDWLLITLRRMPDVVVDAGRRTVTVGPGARWDHVLPETGRHGLAPACGSAPGVGVIGYTLGGGIGPLLSRRYGYAADHVRRMEVVTADGTVREVTPDGEPDLFWALLGCKGNFGVVTRMEFGVFPVRRFFGGGLWFRGEDMADVLDVWRSGLAGLDERTTTSVAVQRLPPLPDLPPALRGAFVLHVRVGHLGPAAEGEHLVAPLRAAAPLLRDTLAERPYEEVGDIHVDPVRAAYMTETTVGLRELTSDTLAAYAELTGPDSGCPLSTVEIRALGGALDREPPVPNSVPSRGIPFVTFAVGVAGPSGAGRMTGHLAAYAQGMAAWGDDRSIMNFLSPDAAREETDMRRLFGGRRYDRLAAVKRRYDPGNMFRLNHNVRPA